MSIDIEEKLANPETTGALISSDTMELEEAQKVLANCALIALENNQDVARRVSDTDRFKIKLAILNTPIDTLYKRIEAVGVQNPGCLAEALKRCGYGLKPDGNGGIYIDPMAENEGYGAAGKPIDWYEAVDEMNEMRD